MQKEMLKNDMFIQTITCYDKKPAFYTHFRDNGKKEKE